MAKEAIQQLIEQCQELKTQVDGLPALGLDALDRDTEKIANSCHTVVLLLQQIRSEIAIQKEKEKAEIEKKETENSKEQNSKEEDVKNEKISTTHETKEEEPCGAGNDQKAA